MPEPGETQRIPDCVPGQSQSAGQWRAVAQHATLIRL